MRPDRGQHISQIFHAARERPLGERAAFLSAACGDDEALRAEVESLLAHEATADRMMAVPALEVAGRAVADAADPSLSLVGRRIGAYQITAWLGAGGMGEVFQAYDTMLRRPVALKLLTGQADDATARTRLLHEARSAAALIHPNICTIYEVGEADGATFIAMEFVEGRSLRDRIDEGVLSVDEAVRLGLEAADALAYAHEHGVVHRDFKAANVIVTPAGRLKIVDFGLARRADPLIATVTMTASIVPAGSVAGTPYAMAPEQIRGDRTDARTDIWALGVLLHEMVSGAPPFAASTKPELFSSILRDPPAPLPDTVPAQLRLVIERCLDKAPDRRYQRASDVRAALEAIPLRAPTRWARWRGRVARRRNVALASLVATAAVLAGLSPAARWFFSSSTESGSINLAVLPLDNRTGDAQQEYFSDGVTEELIAALSRLRPQRLSVVARAASMPYKHRHEPLDQIGRELGANIVLKGSIARSGDRVQIAVELTQTSSGRTVWKEKYDRQVTDLFAVEREISDAAVRALQLELGDSDKKQLAQSRRVNPEAYDLYLRGLFHALSRQEAEVAQAIALLEQSAALDPTFVPTQSYLALAYGDMSWNYRPNDPQWEEKAFAAAQKTLNLDPDAPEAHYARAVTLWSPSRGFPSRQALAELRKALVAQPNFDEAWHYHGVILFHVGHLEAGLRDIERALEINPSHMMARFRLGPIYNYQQKFDEAVAVLDRVSRNQWAEQWTYQKAWALISLGRLEQASRLVDRALEENPKDEGGILHAARAMLRIKRGDREGAKADIAEAIRVGEGFMHFHHTAYSIGAVYTALGDFDKAQDWIENAANTGFPNYALFERDVHLERLRATPRFRAFLARLRQEWEHIPGEPD